MRHISYKTAALSLLLSTICLHASPLSLNEAIELLKTQNLEIKNASLDAQSAHSDVKIAQGYHYGSLDFTQSFLRSNDAGNVFGFKLGSREADFGDFGFNEFLGQMSGLPGNSAQLLATQPKDLNYPGYQNYAQSKLTYSLPLYTGGKLSGYEKIAEESEKIKQLDAAGVTAEKIYETRKSYYDMALLEYTLTQLEIIHGNISTLERTTQAMMNEGYAKKIDLLEVQAKRANVTRMIGELKANKKLLYRYLSFLLNQNVTEISLPADDRLQCVLSEEDTVASNLDLQKALRGLEIREKMIDVAYAPFLPQIGAFAEASTADNTLFGNFSDHKGYTLGARLTWNLFSGGTDTASLEKARIGQLKTKSEIELAKQGIALQYDKIRTEIENHDLQIESLQKELELADAIYRNYEGRYREHLVPINDVLIKHSEQIEKLLTLKKIKNGRNERIFALEKLSNGAFQ